jgi:hypothetical protein
VICASCFAVSCVIYDADTLDMCTRTQCDVAPDPPADAGPAPVGSTTGGYPTTTTTSSSTSSSGTGGRGTAGAGGSPFDAGRTTSTGAGGAAGSGTGTGGAAGSTAGSGGGAFDAGTPDATPISDSGRDPTAQCPSTISFVNLVSTAQHGMPQNGPTSTDICPSGQALIGYGLSAIRPSNFTTDLVSKIEPSCGVLAIKPDQGGCKIVVSPGANLPTRGRYSNGATVQTCPSNQVIVAFKGRSGRDLDQIGFGCATVNIIKVNGSYRADVGAITFLGTVGGTGGSAFQDGCPSNQIAVGNKITDENGFIGAFGLVCATPSLLP